MVTLRNNENEIISSLSVWGRFPAEGRAGGSGEPPPAGTEGGRRGRFPAARPSPPRGQGRGPRRGCGTAGGGATPHAAPGIAPAPGRGPRRPGGRVSFPPLRSPAFPLCLVTAGAPRGRGTGRPAAAAESPRPGPGRRPGTAGALPEPGAAAGKEREAPHGRGLGAGCSRSGRPSPGCHRRGGEEARRPAGRGGDPSPVPRTRRVAGAERGALRLPPAGPSRRGSSCYLHQPPAGRHLGSAAAAPQCMAAAAGRALKPCASWGGRAELGSAPLRSRPAGRQRGVRRRRRGGGEAPRSGAVHLSAAPVRDAHGLVRRGGKAGAAPRRPGARRAFTRCPEGGGSIPPLSEGRLPARLPSSRTR